MKGFDKCLSCGEETKNKKYCNDKCKQKYYYSTNSDLREKKKLDVKNKRKEISIEKYTRLEQEKVRIIKMLKDGVK